MIVEQPTLVPIRCNRPERRLYKSSIIFINYVQISSYAGLQLKGRRVLWSEIKFVNVVALHKTAAAYTLFHIYWSNSPSRLTNLMLEQPTWATILSHRSVAPTSDFCFLNGPMDQYYTACAECMQMCILRINTNLVNTTCCITHIFSTASF